MGMRQLALTALAFGIAAAGCGGASDQRPSEDAANAATAKTDAANAAAAKTTEQAAKTAEQGESAARDGREDRHHQACRVEVNVCGALP
jgi:hypothetical protein